VIFFSACVNCTRDGHNVEDELVGNCMARFIRMMRASKENGENGQLAKS
jgi:hypothetical protein